MLNPFFLKKKSLFENCLIKKGIWKNDILKADPRSALLMLLPTCTSFTWMVVASNTIYSHRYINSSHTPSIKLLDFIIFTFGALIEFLFL